MAQITKTTLISEVKVGDIYTSTGIYASDYSEKTVTDIKITKGGRYRIFISYTYLPTNSFCSNREIANGALKGDQLFFRN